MCQKSLFSQIRLRVTIWKIQNEKLVYSLGTKLTIKKTILFIHLINLFIWQTIKFLKSFKWVYWTILSWSTYSFILNLYMLYFKWNREDKSCIFIPKWNINMCTWNFMVKQTNIPNKFIEQLYNVFYKYLLRACYISGRICSKQKEQ